MLNMVLIFIIFLIYIVFWIQLPGLLFSELLLVRKHSVATRLLTGFFIGFTVLAILYYFESLFNIPLLITVAGPIFSIIAIVFAIRSRYSLLGNNEKIKASFITIFFILFFISTVGLGARFCNATSGITTQVYHDYLFHTGNIISLSRSFPGNDIRVAGLTLYYHYFMELLFAMCKHIFGVNAFDLYMSGNALICAWPLSLALTVLGERLCNGKKVSEKTFFMYCFGMMTSCVGIQLLTNAYAREVVSWTNNHLLVNANALGLAVSIIIVFYEILVGAWDFDFSIKTGIVIALLTIAVTGIKGPTGLLIVAITFSVFVIQSIIEKNIVWSRLWYSLIEMFAFAITYVLVVAGTTVKGSNNHETTLSTYGTLKCSAISSLLYDHCGIDYLQAKWMIICLILCVIFITGPLFPIVASFIVNRFKGLFKTGKIDNIYDWFVIGSILIAYIGFCTITIEGMSQAYLVISVVPFIYYCAVRYSQEKSNWLVQLICRGTWILGIVLILLETTLYCVKDINQQKVFSSFDGGREDRVSSEVMDGYLWLRDNTDEDALVAVDIHSENLDYREIYFYCGAFSERQCYIEGYDYSDVSEEVTSKMMTTNNQLFSDNKYLVKDAIEKTNIDYLVVTEREHPAYENDNDYYELVFRNEKVQIYKVNNGR